MAEELEQHGNPEIVYQVRRDSGGSYIEWLPDGQRFYKPYREGAEWLWLQGVSSPFDEDVKVWEPKVILHLSQILEAASKSAILSTVVN